MSTDPDSWVYGDYAPDPSQRDFVGMKAQWIIKRLPGITAPAVLDYGTGEGKYLHLIRKARPQARLVGVDVRDAHNQVDFEFHRVDPGDALPFAANNFDVVVSCDVLEHVTDLGQSLDQIQRVLRTGGAFIGFVPLEGGIGPHAFFRLINPDIYRETKDHNHAYRRSEITGELSRRFRIVKLGYSYHMLGSALDAAFFASFKVPGIGSRVEKFWRGQENVFYRKNATTAPFSAIGLIAQAASRVAYWESQLLADFPFGASGLHFHVEKP